MGMGMDGPEETSAMSGCQCVPTGNGMSSRDLGERLPDLTFQVIKRYAGICSAFSLKTARLRASLRSSECSQRGKYSCHALRELVGMVDLERGVVFRVNLKGVI